MSDKTLKRRHQRTIAKAKKAAAPNAEANSTTLASAAPVSCHSSFTRARTIVPKLSRAAPPISPWAVPPSLPWEPAPEDPPPWRQTYRAEAAPMYQERSMASTRTGTDDCVEEKWVFIERKFREISNLKRGRPMPAQDNETTEGETNRRVPPAPPEPREKSEGSTSSEAAKTKRKKTRRTPSAPPELREKSEGSTSSQAELAKTNGETTRRILPAAPKSREKREASASSEQLAKKKIGKVLRAASGFKVQPEGATNSRTAGSRASRSRSPNPRSCPSASRSQMMTVKGIHDRAEEELQMRRRGCKAPAAPQTDRLPSTKEWLKAHRIYTQGNHEAMLRAKPPYCAEIMLPSFGKPAAKNNEVQELWQGTFFSTVPSIIAECFESGGHGLIPMDDEFTYLTDKFPTACRYPMAAWKSDKMRGEILLRDQKYPFLAIFGAHVSKHEADDRRKRKGQNRQWSFRDAKKVSVCRLYLRPVPPEGCPGVARV